MAEYHVGCGLAGIYAGTLKKNKKNEWQSKSEVSEECPEWAKEALEGDQK